MTRPKDAGVAEEAGASFVGVVCVPGSPRCVSPAWAGSIASEMSIPLVVVVAGLDAAGAARTAIEAGAAVIQLHGSESEDLVRELRDRGPWQLWKAVRVRGEDDILKAAERYGSLVDLLLLDGWHPQALGGTGNPFPWSALGDVRGRIPLELLLGVAGGLSPGNVTRAIEELAPDLVDVSSGVEASPGIKDPDLIRSFLEGAGTARSRTGGN